MVEGGTFVTKIFRSKDYNSLLWVFNQLFAKVEATKPPSSRNVSAEIFVVCRGYKAPKHLDPKFLDARSVFAELSDPTPNNEAKVFKPEVKKRKREGYEEGDWTQFKEAPVSDFIQTTDPIAMLGGLNKLSFEQKPNGDIAVATIDKLPETTKEIRDCCADLKVLGRADFKRLLRWRLRVREIFGFATKKTKAQEEEKAKEAQEGDEVAEIESMDEEMQIQEELERLKEKDSKARKKQRRAENERKQKEITRLQMNMATPFEIGLEQAGPTGEDSMFALKAVDKAGALNKIAKGKMAQVVEREQPEEIEEEPETDDEEDRLERELDSMYGDYVEQRSARDAKYRAKRARKQDDDGEWNGFSDEDKEQSDDEELVQDADSDWSDDEEEGPKGLITDLDNEEQPKTGLTKRAARFFDQDIFKGIDGLEDLEEDDDSGIDVEHDTEMKDESATPAPAAETGLSIRTSTKTSQPKPALDDESSDEEDKIEEVKRDESQWEQDNVPMKNGKPDIDIITAEAMTLAHQMATGQKTKYDLLDESFNR